MLRVPIVLFFFFTAPATTEIYTLSLHDALTLSTQSGLRYLSYLPSLWLNKLRGTQGVEFFKSESLLCEPLAANPVYAQIDGEPLARLPVEFRIVPRALKLLVPRNPQ